jgi:hypothetical protein
LRCEMRMQTSTRSAMGKEEQGEWRMNRLIDLVRAWMAMEWTDIIAINKGVMLGTHTVEVVFDFEGTLQGPAKYA